MSYTLSLNICSIRTWVLSVLSTSNVPRNKSNACIPIWFVEWIYEILPLAWGHTLKEGKKWDTNSSFHLLYSQFIKQIMHVCLFERLKEVLSPKIICIQTELRFNGMSGHFQSSSFRIAATHKGFWALSPEFSWVILAYQWPQLTLKLHLPSWQWIHLIELIKSKKWVISGKSTS